MANPAVPPGRLSRAALGDESAYWGGGGVGASEPGPALAAGVGDRGSRAGGDNQPCGPGGGAGAWRVFVLSGLLAGWALDRRVGEMEAVLHLSSACSAWFTRCVPHSTTRCAPG